VTRPSDLRARADMVLELHEAGELEAALEACDELIALAGDDLDDPVVRESVFSARFERALVLTELGELEDAAGAYAHAAATPADLDDPDQRHEVAMAMLNRGICLDTTGDHDEAIAAYDELIGRFGSAADPVTHDQVVRGRVNRAAALLATGDTAPALDEAAELAGELDPHDALEAEQLAMLARLRAGTLRSQGDLVGAAAALAEAERCSDSDPAVRLQVATAHRERAEVLAELGEVDAAAEVLDAAIVRLEEDPDPAVREVGEELAATRSRFTRCR